MPLLPRAQMRFEHVLQRIAATSPRDEPLRAARLLVTTTAARRAARSVFRALRMSSLIAVSDPLVPAKARKPSPTSERLDSARGSETQSWHQSTFSTIHTDRAAAGEPDLPGGLVGDAEFERLRLAALDHVERLGHHRALDAAARHRAEEIALVVDHQIRADRPRRRAPGLDHGRERDAAPCSPATPPRLSGCLRRVRACNLRRHLPLPSGIQRAAA